MAKTSKPPKAHVSPDELLRCQLVAELRSKLDGGHPLKVAVTEIAARTHFVIQTGEAVSVTTRSLYRWLSKFKAGGWDALRTQPRKEPRYPALPTALLDFLRKEKISI